jgi:hypothetical protein
VRSWKISALAASGIGLLAGCAGDPQIHEVKEIYVCAAEECGTAGQSFTANQILNAIYQLIKRNDGKDFRICASDPKTRSCVSEGVGYFVQGGPFPGLGTTASGNLHDVKLDAPNQVITATMSSYLRFLGVPLVCVPHASTISVRSADEITISDSPYYCNWMAVGNMTASFSFAVESVDLDKGRLGGYWAHGVAGVANGKGSGYAIIEFQEPMPRTENWLRSDSDAPVLRDRRVAAADTRWK